MLIFIIIGVVAILAKFAYDRNKQSIKVTKEGGMKNKYSLLVDYIMSGDSSVRITRQTSTSIDFCLSNAGGATAFFLTQTFGNLTVQWKMHSPIFGDHKFEWDFPEYLDQVRIVARINNDLEKYQSNVMSAHGFPRIDDLY
jgi:hypothetical protein